MTDKTTMARSSQIIGFSLSTPDPNRPPQKPPGPGKPPVEPPGPDKPPVEPPPDPEKPPAIPPGTDKPPVMRRTAAADTSAARTGISTVEFFCCPAATGIAALPKHPLSVARHS
jgi:hypothetical protein